MFFYAYREFVRALGQNDKQVLKKMTEPMLFKAIEENQQMLDKCNMEYYTVDDNIKLKMKLLDM